MRHQAVPLFAAATILLGVSGAGGAAFAQDATVAQAQPSPSPSPSSAPGSKFSLKLQTYTSATNNQMVGPGTTPPEAPGFAAGGALAPGTPYDFFSGAPLVTGQGISQDFLITPAYDVLPNLGVSATFGYGGAAGTGNVVNYWGDALMPTVNPNLGMRAFTLMPAFPTHNGQDPVNAARVSILSGSIFDPNGNGALTVGWFNLHQNVPFALSQAPWTNTPFQVVPQIPGSLGDGSPNVDVLREDTVVLPLSGADAWYKYDLATFEVATALLPAPTNSPARIMTASTVIDHGSGLRYSGELTLLNTSGPDTGRVLFGSGATLVNGVPQSTVFDQHMVVAGVGATFPIGNTDVEARYGYSCYGASGTAGTTSACTSGNYYYGKVHHGFSHFDLALDGVRFEGSYAPAILDYGTLENVWTYPAAWPGTWLRGDYQLVDNSEVGPNRQGGRISTTFIIAGVEARLAFAQYWQIQPLDASSAFSAGFVEPYFLPQTTAPGTTGNEQHWEAWFNYHARFADVTLDFSQVNAWRQAPAGQPQDNVVMSYPSGVLSFARGFGPKITGAAGFGIFSLSGQFDTSGPNNAALTENLIFAGVQYRANATTGYGLQWRLYSTFGVPTLPAGPSPAYHGPQIQFYQRFKT